MTSTPLAFKPMLSAVATHNNNNKKNNKNMQFKGTNGWFLDKDGYLKDENCDIIADFFITNQEDLANAKLASKAQEMIKTLNKVLIHVDWSYENWTLNDGLIIKNEIETLIKEATEL